MCEGFLPELPQTCPKRFGSTFAYKFYHEDLFWYWYDLQYKGLHVFCANVGRHFLKSNCVWRHFCPDFQVFCLEFQGFCPDFQEFYAYFRQIKTSRGTLAPPAPRLHPLHPRLLHHCVRMRLCRLMGIRLNR